MFYLSKFVADNILKLIFLENKMAFHVNCLLNLHCSDLEISLVSDIKSILVDKRHHITITLYVFRQTQSTC